MWVLVPIGSHHLTRAPVLRAPRAYDSFVVSQAKALMIQHTVCPTQA